MKSVAEISLICSLLFLGQASLAQSSCRHLFDVGRSVENFVPDLELNDANVDRFLSRRGYIERLILAKNNHDKLQITQEYLREFGIGSEILENSSWFGLINKKFIRLLPTGDTSLNKIAELMKQKYNTDIIYDPEVTKDGTEGAYDGRRNMIFISDETLSHRQPDLTLLHEIRHAAMTSKEKRGLFSLTNGLMVKWSSQWPWRKKSASSYSSYLNFQEIATWRQDTNLRLTYIKYKSRLNQLKISNTISLISELSINLNQSLDILRDALESTNFLIERMTHSSWFASVDFNKKTNTLDINKLGLSYFISQSVPRRLLDQQLTSAGLLQNSISLADFFKTSEGKKFARTTAIFYLQQLRQDLESRISSFENLNSQIKYIWFSLSRENQKRLEFSDREIAEEIKNILENLSINDQNLSLNLPKSIEDISEKAAQGFDFSKISSAEYIYTESKEIIEAQSAKLQLSEIEVAQIVASAKSSYSKINLDLIIQNRNFKLVVECPVYFEGNISVAYQFIRNMNATIVKTEVYSFLNDLSSETTTEALDFIKMNTHEISQRNQLRLLLIQKEIEDFK